MSKIKGFSLIEIMVVIAIIGILAAIAIPTYRLYVKNTQIKSCLYEVKNYSNFVYVDLFDQDDTTIPFAPTPNACINITDASQWTDTSQHIIKANVKNYSSISIECNLDKNSQCLIIE